MSNLVKTEDLPCLPQRSRSVDKQMAIALIFYVPCNTFTRYVSRNEGCFIAVIETRNTQVELTVIRELRYAKFNELQR